LRNVLSLNEFVAGRSFGAGIIVIAESTGNILVTQRGKKVNNPMQWTFIGGNGDAGETPEQAAVREAYEETGMQIEEKSLIPLRLHERKGKKYYTFVTYIPAEIEVDYHPEEVNDARWVGVDEIPEPVHHWIKECFAKAGNLDTLKNLIFRVIEPVHMHEKKSP
jgi:8-oxo-dGTP diphosphatase